MSLATVFPTTWVFWKWIFTSQQHELIYPCASLVTADPPASPSPFGIILTSLLACTIFRVPWPILSYAKGTQEHSVLGNRSNNDSLTRERGISKDNILCRSAPPSPTATRPRGSGPKGRKHSESLSRSISLPKDTQTVPRFPTETLT